MNRMWIALGAWLAVAFPSFAWQNSPTPSDGLTAYLKEELRDKKIPAISLRIVDDQKVVFSLDLGHQDYLGTKPVTPLTGFRAGGITKLLTAICVMQLVEEKALGLDDNVVRLVPEFSPANIYKKPISLRALLAHRSGLLREPPEGNIYDPTNPGLKKIVQSLEALPLVYEPDIVVKHSNAGYATLGYLLEKFDKKPYAEVVKSRIFDKLGMTHSSFSAAKSPVETLAEGKMWTYFGKEFPSPKTEISNTSASGLITTSDDLAKLISSLNRKGEGLLKPATFESMIAPQYLPPDFPGGMGLGFFVSDLEGKKLIGHPGRVPGFTSNLSVMPGEKVGVIVLTSKDAIANWVNHVADEALRDYIGRKKNLPGLTFERFKQVPVEEIRRLEGKYANRDTSVEITEREGRLMLFPNFGGFWQEYKLSDRPNEYVSDDGLSFNGRFRRVERIGNGVQSGPLFLERRPASDRPPPEPPQEFRELIGEYGPDTNIVHVFEKDGNLWCNLDWFELVPLIKDSNDAYLFPDNCTLAGEKLIFLRNPLGKAISCFIGNVRLSRRKLDGEDGKTFKVQVTRPVKELEPLAKKSEPPKESIEEKRPSELVELAKLDPLFKFDLRYATKNNFLDTAVYPKEAKGYMQKPAAEALVRVQAKLKSQNLGLMIFDPYRPWYVTKIFWDAVPEKFHNFVADPSKGSRHNRGCAVDLGLYDLKTGKYIDAVSGYDEFSDRAYPNYIGGTSRQRWYRDLLRKAMESEGFTVYEDEWWHFDYKDWKHYGIGNQTFEELANAKP
ncbi:serine hydrolase [Telmatocola sphagniphila]|uniref:D-alanyl-D-alanine dipeptidase n=1 Tax=Telmatocola sphagniphila TaxID=1123043 RepID=A0A8E6B7Z6_9BACT|nr:serine hydrolase [Telmatocola sphagniphila]QVL33164.1 serine hydrolase [Telmatocola sphagniphila]